MTTFLSLYILILLFNLFFIDKLVDINMQKGICLKNYKVWKEKTAKYNADLALARK